MGMKVTDFVGFGESDSGTHGVGFVVLVDTSSSEV